MSAVDILLPAFVFTVLLVASHTYLGLHVLARGIIFVDLALAQIAALGASLAFLLGGDVHGWRSRLFALAATLAAAVGFSLLRRVPDKTAREVIIGSVYVIATALSVLVLSRSAQGMEALKALFNGSILWVSWEEISVVAVAYAVIAVVHVACRRRFETLSFDGAGTTGGEFGWELVFFASFAVVITLAVNAAGILVVFAFLVIPAFSAALIAASFAGRLALGVALGLAAGTCGLALAYAADLPVGATVVAVLGALPVLCGLLRGALLRGDGGGI